VTDTLAIQKIGEPAGGRTTLKVTNRRAASGGAEQEALPEAAGRARHDLTMPYQAITSGDYEQLARSTPGLRVARAKAIPLFKPGLKNYPEEPEPAAITVIVVPFSRADQPRPSQGFLQTIRRHLDRHRLVTARVYVIGPDYVRVEVQTTVLLRGGFSSTDVQQQIRTALNRFLHPLSGGPEGNGWPFGRTVYKSEVYQVIENVEGVDGVQRLDLGASDDQGNIKIPPQSLVYAGDHRIGITNPDAVLR
jgi:predicted phage baseplate assembly protein